MRRIYRWFTLLLPVILLVGACQPLLAPAARYPRLEVQGHVSGATLTVAVQGDYAYLGFSYEFVVLDIADRRNPHWVAALPISTNAIALAGDYAYVVGKGGFTVVNIADPTQPQPLASLGSQETAVGVVLAAGDAYFIEGRRLYQVDIADHTQPWIRQSITLPSRGKHLAIAGSYLYVSSYAGLHVFDWTMQPPPGEVCAIQSISDVSGVVVTKSYVLFASDSTLHIVDMTTPTACQTITQITMPGWVSDLAVANDMLYVANGTHDLQVWDITNPQSPVAIGAYTTGGLALTVTVQDGYLYLVDCNEGLHIYAIADAAHLTAVGHFTPLGITANLAVVGAYAYLTAGLPLHLHQLDLTAPAQIPIIQNRRTSAPIYDIVAVDERLYLLTAEALEIIDVTTPAKLFTVAVYPIAEPTLQNLWYVAANRTHAYLGDTVGDVWLVDLTTAPQPLKSPAYRGLGQVGGNGSR